MITFDPEFFQEYMSGLSSIYGRTVKGVLRDRRKLKAISKHFPAATEIVDLVETEPGLFTVAGRGA